MAGYEDTNDAERLCVDPAMRHIAGGRTTEHRAASTSQMGRFETEILTQPKNLEFLMNPPGRWVDQVRENRSQKQIILDMDSSVSPIYGKQEGSAYKGYIECTCYHPLFCFNQYGDIERVHLRGGNVHSADGWRHVLEPIVDRYRGNDILRFYRGDAGFANPDLYSYLETEGYSYAIRLKANAILYGQVEHLLTRPVGRSPKKPVVRYYSFRYQAASWDTARRVVARVEWHAGELFPRIGFIVTNLRWKSANVVKFYNQRGTAEQWIKEGKYVLNWTRLSCHNFVDNQVRLQLFALAYDLGKFLRQLALPESVKE